MLVAATASGFVGQWVTEWYAYHPVVKERLGLKAGERVAGFIYIGTAAEALEERPRPDMEKIASFF
jgi:nitroreductase